MGDDAGAPVEIVGIDERRRGRSVVRQHGGCRYSPDELAAREIERRQNAADPEREDAAAGNALSEREQVTWAEVSRLPLCLLTPDMQNRRIINRYLAQRRGGKVSFTHIIGFATRTWPSRSRTGLTVTFA